MQTGKSTPALLLALLAGFALLPQGDATDAPATNPVAELIGVWQARRNFGPEVRGTLTMTRQGDDLIAEIGAYRVVAKEERSLIQFELPGGRGEFHGEIELRNQRIRGHWIQPPTVSSGRPFASPVALRLRGSQRWEGTVAPLEDEFTIYLVASARPDGSIGAFLRNPDRNIGVFLAADHLEREGNKVKLVGSRGDGQTQRTFAEGTYYPEQGRLSLYLAPANGTYDFERIDNDPASGFYARGKNPGAYSYVAPPPQNDGWKVGTLQQVGISFEPIRKLVETEIDRPATSVHDLYIHGFLIARHGTLVFEDYFHGFHREKPHDSRSASKSLTATLVGAAIQSSAPLQVNDSVYRIIYGENLAGNLDERKKKMTVAHLLNMSSGYECDDRNPKAKGNEDVMQEQTEDPDWYHYTLTLPMADEPGKTPVYCSAVSNLLGNVVSAATQKPLTELFDTLIATPLQINRYYLMLMPTGQPYMGGGIRWLPRDFMKLGQVMLEGGSWNGRRIVSREWAARSTAPQVELRNLRYAYQWWNIDYPYKNRKVRAFFAGGNGGQIIMGVPELDLVIAFYAGNYNDRVLFRIQNELIPQYILPAVQDRE